MDVLGRTAGLATLLVTLITTGGRAQAYPTNFGLATPLIAAGSTLTVTYVGWEATTVFGDDIYALTGDQYSTDLANGCFSFSAQYRTTCDAGGSSDLAGLLGIQLFGPDSGGGKPYGVTCPDPSQACFGPPVTDVISWIPGTEVIIALLVDQGAGDYNWFFSGDPARNLNVDGTDGYAHIAYFADGVGGNDGIGIVPGTVGVGGLYGFEDVTYEYSDWDFDNAIIGIDPGSVGVPTTDVVPEPATVALVASGLAGLGAFAKRRRRRATAEA